MNKLRYYTEIRLLSADMVTLAGGSVEQALAACDTEINMVTQDRTTMYDAVKDAMAYIYGDRCHFVGVVKWDTKTEDLILVNVFEKQVCGDTVMEATCMQTMRINI